MKQGRKILQLQNVAAGYGTAQILENISLTVFDHDFIGVIGSNGSGKTTLLKVILGLIKPTAGEVRFFFEYTDDPRRRLGYLPQVSWFDHQFPISVYDVVLSGLTGKSGLLSSFSQQEHDHVASIMDRLDIRHLQSKAIGHLSGGEAQRVFLARALVSSPRLLLLDEPNTFVDQDFQHNFFEVLKQLNKEMAIILVSHDLGMISSHVKTIACVNHFIYYHPSNEISQQILDNYNCPIDLITHGHLPHRVLKEHGTRNRRDDVNHD